MENRTEEGDLLRQQQSVVGGEGDMQPTAFDQKRLAAERVVRERRCPRQVDRGAFRAGVDGADRYLIARAAGKAEHAARSKRIGDAAAHLRFADSFPPNCAAQSQNVSRETFCLALHLGHRPRFMGSDVSRETSLPVFAYRAEISCKIFSLSG